MDVVNSRTYLRFTELKLHHVIFWFVYLIFWVFFYHSSNSSLPVTLAITVAFIIVSVHGVASYINIYILFPRLLKQKQYFMYVVSVLLTVSLSCLILVVAFLFSPAISYASKSSIWTFDFFVTNAISVSYTLAITMSLKLVKQWYERERLTDNLEKIQTETELKYLKHQINPHFLFNSLNSLYALTLTKSDKAPELVLKLSEILRYVLYDSSERWVPLDKEINYIKSYLALEEIRNGDRLKVDFNIEGDTSGKKVAPLIFLTFLENSFKHGIAASTGEGFVHVNMKVTEDEIHFHLTNSKPKEAEKAISKLGGIGLVNLKKRLQILYEGRHALRISEKDQAYTVDLVLPN
jgi:two-component system LytT family sensor kinase